MSFPPETVDRIHTFLEGHELAVISTLHANRPAPESAIVGFASTPDLELVFGTSVNTRKYVNLQANPAVSLVVGWNSDHGSVQYEGLATELDAQSAASLLALLAHKNEIHREFAANPDQRWFRVQPAWIRFFDNTADPPAVHESSVEVAPRQSQ